MPLQVKATGPEDARIMIVGEAPSRNDVLAGEPFVGTTGKELTNMLHDAGIIRTECYITNVIRQQPPGGKAEKFFLKNTPKNRIPGPEVLEGIRELKQEIVNVRPNVIIALGDIALWALTDERGITKWRGSILEIPWYNDMEFQQMYQAKWGTPPPKHIAKVIPTYQPAAILRKWDWRFIAVQDLRRAAKEAEFQEIKYPDYQFVIRPSFDGVMRTLDMLLEMADRKSNVGDCPGVSGDFTATPYPNDPTENAADTDATGVSRDADLSPRKKESDYDKENTNHAGAPAGERADKLPSSKDEGRTGKGIQPNAEYSGQDRAADTVGREATPAQHQERGRPQNQIMLSGDTETRGGHIACMGIGWSETEAICIPFLSVGKPEGYWDEEEETAIVIKLLELFKHPNIFWVYQNGIYDYQYFAVNWGFIPRIGMDTMLAQHTCFSGLPKGLDFQSSLYCKYHRYWKDEGKEFHESIRSPEEEDKYWMYNCKDCVATFEIALVHFETIGKLDMWGPYTFQMEQFMPVLRMMLRGVKIDQQRKKKLAVQLLDALTEREVWMKKVLGRVLNPKSPKQMKEFFYDELGLPIQKNRKTGKPTLDDEALQTLAKKEPLVRPLVQVIQEYRSIGVFFSTFVKANLSFDGRARSSYNIAGAETFRWSSSKDAFGQGLNLQNIPKGTEK